MCPRITLPKDVQGLYTKNCSILCTWVRRLNILRCNSSQWIYKFNVFKNKIIADTFVDIDKPLLRLMWKYKGPGASQVALVVKNLTANAGDLRDTVWFPGWEDPLGEAWQLTSVFSPGESPGALQRPWTEELSGLESIGSQRVRHDWSDLAHAQKGLKITKGASQMALVVKNSPANAGDAVRSLGLEDALRRAWKLTPVFLPGESHGQRTLAGYSP